MILIPQLEDIFITTEAIRYEIQCNLMMLGVIFVFIMKSKPR